MEIHKVLIKKLGPIGSADMDLGDLTVLVGPQATGKSICLQLIKLFLDAGYIKGQLWGYGYDWHESMGNFLSIFLGEGMDGIWRVNQTKVEINDQGMGWSEIESRKSTPRARAYYIPAQRVVTVENSWPKTFTTFDSSYPFVVREFSESLRFLLEAMSREKEHNIFPGERKLKGGMRISIGNSIFRGAELILKRRGNKREMVLSLRQNRHIVEIAVGSWSAGQREFVPFLLGMYYLCPGGRVARVGNVRVVIVEEIEMGLHPMAISDAVLLLMDLLSRGYQVIVSTHSPIFLDFLWAIRHVKAADVRGRGQRFLGLFGIHQPTADLLAMADKCLRKRFKVYFFEPGGRSREGKRDTVVKDISDLDPGSDDAAMAGWGGLTEFSAKAADIVAGLSETRR